MTKITVFLSAILALYIGAVDLAASPLNSRPGGIVSASDIEPSLILDIRYFGPHNFVGQPIDGYKAPLCLLSKPAALALQKVQKDLLKQNFSLKAYDCYRPQRAVNHFVRWAEKLDDLLMKKEFYPRVDKENLFKDGYIASKSGHSRASTIDLTIVKLPAKEQPPYTPGEPLKDCTLPQADRYSDNSIDMGTGFDCFDALSHTQNPAMSPTQKANRELLVKTMEKFGFQNYSQEWWHFTLKDEPYATTYFDFPIESL